MPPELRPLEVGGDVAGEEGDEAEREEQRPAQQRPREGDLLLGGPARAEPLPRGGEESRQVRERDVPQPQEIKLPRPPDAHRDRRSRFS